MIVCRCSRCGAINESPDEMAGRGIHCANCRLELTLPVKEKPAVAVPVTRPRRIWPWLVGLLALLGCGGLAVPVVSLILALMNMSRETGRQYQCRSRIRDIASAMLSYEQDHGVLPPQSLFGPDGKPWHSWRVLLLPYLDQQKLFDRYHFDEPWDGPKNRKLHDHLFAVYRCPTDDSDLTRTSYFVVSGPGLMFEPGKQIKSTDATDGASNTILVVEAAGQDVHWMEPRDLDGAQLANQINAAGQPSISSAHPKIAHVALVDEGELAVGDDADPAAVRAMLTRDAGETVPLPPDRRP